LASEFTIDYRPSTNSFNYLYKSSHLASIIYPVNRCIFATRMKMIRLEGLQALLSSPKKIVVTTHVNPDGDAMGSSLGLALALRKLGHSTQVVTPNSYPDFLKWMPEENDVITGENDLQAAENFISQADIIFHLDYNAYARANQIEQALRASKAIRVMIDHHQQPEEWPDYIYSDISIGSTCQMIYEWLEMNNWLNLIDADVATCLYTGIVTDSGSFRFASTTPRTHMVAAQLLACGAQPAEVYSHIFDSNSIDRMQLLGVMLKQMIVLPHKKAVVLYLNQGQLFKNNYQKGDSEGFVNYGLSISGMQLSIFLREDKDMIKLSLRSKSEIDVNQLSRAHFNGGGHKNAAGGSLKLTMKEALDYTRNIIENPDLFK